MTKEQITIIRLAMLGKIPMEVDADKDGFFECETEECVFNNNGICRYHAVYDELPAMTEEDGCLCGVFDFSTESGEEECRDDDDEEDW